MYAKRAEHIVRELGFTAIKCNLDVPNPHQLDTHCATLTHAGSRFMTKLVTVVREGVGETVDIAFDCHWRLDRASVVADGRFKRPRSAS